ncbi:hypothetical protein DM860_007202 [Cuscuta australis]|uniref:Uncharacterized protein n=1 Tax=Cuscuta australis TaxID=267555 RepID=A0A328E317_9ASTE|nr:hypothetical protein DM860_007202 [Cuscuta australis]
MSQPLQLCCIQDGRLTPWKHVTIFPNHKLITNVVVVKGFLAICLVASVSLFSFSAFSRWTSTAEYSASGVRRLESEDPNNATRISHILFGISGSLKTWGTRRRYCEAWWKPEAAIRGFVWLDRAPQKWPESSPPYRVSANTSGLRYTCWYGSRAAVRIARVVKESFELGEENVRWFVMGDDDTVFFPENVAAVLSKYDHNQMYYVGSVSESVEQDEVHSYTMAYGGAGFAVSYPLAAALVEILDGCIDRYSSAYGSDQKIGGCMNEIGVPLTREPGFHQLDIRGNAYGLLAAHPVAPLVSLHHLDYVAPLFPHASREQSVKKLLEAYNVDPARTLQQSFCYDLKRKWTVSISWGYTVQLYPAATFSKAAKELVTPLQTFLTWKTWSQGPFTFNTRTLSLDSCKRPIVYYLDRVLYAAGDGLAVSTYNKSVDYRKQCRKQEYVSASSFQSFHVSAPLLHPHIWKKAPRRQCCEVINNGDEVMHDAVHVNIRECYKGESMTPPE